MDAPVSSSTLQSASPPASGLTLRQRWHWLIVAGALMLVALVLAAATVMTLLNERRALKHLQQTAAVRTLALAGQGRWAEAVAPRVGADGYAYLVDSSGALLAAAPKVATGPRDLSDLAVVARAREGGAATRIYRGLSGDLVIGRAQRDPLSGLIAVVETPLGDFAPVILWLLVLWIAGLALAAGAGEWAARHLLSGLLGPLKLLGDGARTALSGDAQVRVRLAGQAGRELTELTGAFNALIGRLGEAQQQIDADKHQLQAIIDQRARELTRKTDQLEIAASIARDLTAIHDPRAVAARAIEQIKTRWRFYRVELLLIDRESERLAPPEGVARSGTPELSLRDPDSLLVWTATSGKPCYVPDVSAEPHYRAAPEYPNSRCALILPLPGPDGRPIGVLNLEADQPNALDGDQRAVLEGLAGHIAAALQSALEWRALERASDQLAQAALHANQANILKSRFLFNASQKLSLPLEQIVGISETLISGVYGALPADVLERQRRILEQGRVIQVLVEDMYDLSAIEAGHLQLNLQPLTVAPLFEEVANAARALQAAVYPTHRAEIRVDLQHLTETPPVRADLDRLRYILINLMSNALKHTQTGEIVLGASATDTDLLITVNDSGPGLGDETLRYLFEPFQHQRAPQVIEDPETGLGLPIARLLAMRHGGDLTVETRRGEGTIFTLRLPCDKGIAPKPGQ